MRVSRCLLQQFARYPEPGRVKTRLQAELSATESCAVHEKLLLRTAATLTQSKLGVTELWLDRAGEHATLSKALDLGMTGPFLQQGSDLGERMGTALCKGLQRADAVVLVGSDCPVLTAGYLETAFDALRHSDVVLGPAEDGGFVLIGCRRVAGGMLAGVPWGDDSVLAATRARLTAEGLSTCELSTLYDIDTPGDLRRWEGELRSGVSGDR